MKQNHPNAFDSVNRKRRNRRGAPQEKHEKGSQSQTNVNPKKINDVNKTLNPQAQKNEGPKGAMQNHFENMLNCLKSNRKKQYLLGLAGIPLKVQYDQDNAKQIEKQGITSYRDSFISDFFFDKPIGKQSKTSLNSQSVNEVAKIAYSNEVRLDKKIGQSYFPIQQLPKYNCSRPHFVDFICNPLYKVQALGGEGENKKINDANDSSPQPAEFANANLSESIDMHSIKTIKYNRLFNDFFDTERKIKFAKKHQINNEDDLLNYIVMKKTRLDEHLHEIEDDRRYIYRMPISLSLNDQNLHLPSFKLSNLHFMYYIILLTESRTSLTPHNRRPISICLKRIIPILLSISNPVIVPWNQTDYYQSLKSKLINNMSNSSVSTSLSPLFESGSFDKEFKKLISSSPQFNFTERNWPCHLLLPPLHIRYLIILFDFLARLDEYLQELPFVLFKSTFALNIDVRSDLTLDLAPVELKRLQDSIEKGGSLTQKFYDLRNISYQMISVNGLRIFDRELQIIENAIKKSSFNGRQFMNFNHNDKNDEALNETILLEKMRHDIIDQNPYSVKFLFDESGSEIGFSFHKADKNKLNVQRKFDESYVFPNYSINTLQPKNDPTLVRYDGILNSNMTFYVTGSNDSSDDQFRVRFTEGSYGIICNYTDLI